MKTAMKFVCLLVLFVGLFSILTLFDIDSGIKEFASKITVIGLFSIFPMIIIALSSYKLEKNNGNALYKGLVGIMFVPIITVTVLTLFSGSFGEETLEFIFNILAFFNKIYIGLVLLLFVLIPESNNRFTTIFQIIAIGAIVFRTLSSVFQSSAVAVNGFGLLGTVVESVIPINSKNFDDTYDIIILIIEFMAILLTYLTNYAFSEDVPSEVIDLDYARLKEDANKITKERFDKLYNRGKEETHQETNTSTDNKLMNINNQLGANSNVGQVSEAAKKVKPQMSAIVQVPIVNKATQVSAKPNAVAPQVPMAKQEPAPLPVSPVANNQVPAVPEQPVQPQVVPQQAVAQHPVAQHPVPQQQVAVQPVQQNTAATVDNMIANQPTGYSNEMAPAPQTENKFIN